MNKLILLFFIIVSPMTYAKKKVKVKYRKHTEFDFAGDKVSGKIKGASVFYIFQRKRSQGHQVISPPERLTWNREKAKQLMKGSLN